MLRDGRTREGGEQGKSQGPSTCKARVLRAFGCCELHPRALRIFDTVPPHAPSPLLLRCVFMAAQVSNFGLC